MKENDKLMCLTLKMAQVFGKSVEEIFFLEEED